MKRRAAARRQVGALEGRINATRNKYLQDARTEATKLSEDLASNRYKLDERQSILGKTTLTAPIAGVVKYLNVTTIGGVLRAGDELMQISPTEGEIVFELKVNPADIGQLSLGLPAAIRLDAFDFSVYGSLAGKLTYLSSDTLAEQGPTAKLTPTTAPRCCSTRSRPGPSPTRNLPRWPSNPA
jgi:adhesin transport system membrane fusion protein